MQHTDTNTTKQRALAAWHEADARFMAALTQAFGKDACNRRYDMDTRAHPAFVREAGAQFIAAGKTARIAMGW